MSRLPLRSFVVAGICALAIGCSPIVDTRGNLPSNERLAQVKPGRTRDQVLNLLGTPSSTAAFGDETWYYISNRTETVAFFKPEEVERKVVAIEFDRGGTVTKVRTLGLDEGKQVDLVERETPTAGNEMTLLQQLIGNIGRFPTENTAPRGLPGTF